jgi:Zn-dependent protease with chaperone function
VDFFESQAAAQRSSRLLMLLFLVAIASVIVLANLTVYLILKFQSLGTFQFDRVLALEIAAGVVILVLLGSLYRIYSLKRGGEAIAAALGGQLVVNGGANEYERRLINVVEEMAIASGLPVPPVYLIHEDGINAFAAGYGSGDAIIGITQGAILNLTRDQLQGVVAHEFSHILNGDMRLNIRLVGVLHGLLMLAIVGRLMLEAKPGVARRTSSAFPVMFLGLSLFCIGYLGKFFGDLIKAAVSRQREFLADASAVQFTRNPDGIAGALKRIGGHIAGSNIHHAGAEEFSHLYFSSGFRRAFIGMLATHPPLEERIRRVDPTWSGEFVFNLPVTEVPADSGGDQLAGVQGFMGKLSPEALTATVGNPGLGELAVARGLIAQVPALIRAAVREPYSVRAVVYLMFLNSNPKRRAAQLEVLQSSADLFVRSRLRELIDQAPEISEAIRLPLLEMALPVLRQLSESEYRRLMANLSDMQKVSQPINLSDWALGYYLTHHLREAFEAVRRPTRVLTSNAVKAEVSYLLSVLAYSDRNRTVSAEDSFAAGQALLDFPVALLPKSDISIPRLEEAVRRLANLKPLQKPRILKAFVAVISADEQIKTVEAELLRCFADAIDCPLPPFTV